MAKGRGYAMKKELKIAIEALGNISASEEVCDSLILKSAFEKLEVKLLREFMGIELSKPGKRAV
jgi:hypothetical protein